MRSSTPRRAAQPGPDDHLAVGNSVADVNKYFCISVYQKRRDVHIHALFLMALRL